MARAASTSSFRELSSSRDESVDAPRTAGRRSGAQNTCTRKRRAVLMCMWCSAFTFSRLSNKTLQKSRAAGRARAPREPARGVRNKRETEDARNRSMLRSNRARPSIRARKSKVSNPDPRVARRVAPPGRPVPRRVGALRPLPRTASGRAPPPPAAGSAPGPPGPAGQQSETAPTSDLRRRMFETAMATGLDLTTERN